VLNKIRLMMMQQSMAIIVVLSCIVAGFCIFQGPSLIKERNVAREKYNNSLNGSSPKAGVIPSSCTIDAQAICDRSETFHPLHTLVRRDPFVRMITLSSNESSSPESSTRILDDLFTDPLNSQRDQAPQSPLNDGALLGAMLEQMIMSAIRFSAAAEEVTSATYYGTRESAAEETFVTMLTSLFDHSDQSSATAEYYHDPNQLRKSVCNYGRNVLSKERKDEVEHTTVDSNTIRLRLARRLSEVETAPDFSDVPMTFVTSFRMINFEDLPVPGRRVANSYSEGEDRQQCLWNAYHSANPKVSFPCHNALYEIELSSPTRLYQIYSNWDYGARTNASIGLASALTGLIALIGYTMFNEDDEDEENDEHDLGYEYCEMSESMECESVDINNVYTGVPFVPLRIV